MIPKELKKMEGVKRLREIKEKEKVTEMIWEKREEHTMGKGAKLQIIELKTRFSSWLVWSCGCLKAANWLLTFIEHSRVLSGQTV